MLNKKSIRSFLFSSRKIRSLLSKLSMEEVPAGRNILVMAPHPDDDVIGCGGSIKLHVNAGHQVNILYLTDGEQGIQNHDKINASTIRMREGKNAAMKLGIGPDKLHFLQLPDGHLSRHTGIHERLQKILVDFKPDTIYLPSFFENHSDHLAANKILKSNLSYRADICAYEVWTPLIPNLLINITQVIHAKLNALEEHASQLEALDYHEAVRGLNRYRGAMYSKNVMYAEAFISCPSDIYFRLMKEER